MEPYRTDVDAEAMLTHMKHADKRIKLKRRWLIGLPTTKYEDQRTKSPTFLQNRSFAGACRNHCLGKMIYFMRLQKLMWNCGSIPIIKKDCHDVPESLQDLDIPCFSKELRYRLDNISNTGLYLLATHFTKSHTMLDKTHWKLKKTIQKYLQRMRICEGNHHLEECVELSQVVTHPSFFRKGSATSFNSRYESPSAKVRWVLGNLENFPSQVLLSMYRKLEGKSGKMFHLETHRSGWNRDRLINRVKRICEKQTCRIEECDELPHSIAKAMAVTTLSLNLDPGIQHQGLADFYQFSPEIGTLQNNITKAIWLINEKVRASELRELQVLLGLKANLPIKGLRSAIRKLLTLYLFVCDDIEVIPKSLLDTLSGINRSSRSVPQKCFPNNEFNEDVECILGVGASARKVFLDLLPDYSYDQEFAYAYMEDLQESECDESDTDDSFTIEFDKLPNNISHMGDSAETAESFGDSNFIEENVLDIDPTISYSNTSENLGIAAEHSGATLQILRDNIKPLGTAVADADEELDHIEQRGSRNQYLRVQDACDESSLFAYKCIGLILNESSPFLGLNLDPVDISYLKNGLSQDATKKQAAVGDTVEGMFLCQVVEDLFPNISNSVKKKLEEIMSLL